MRYPTIPFTAMLMLVFLSVVSPASAQAETTASDVSGLFGGHMHLVVPNVAKHREIWKLLGGVEKSSGPLKALKFPGMFILLREAEPSSPSKATTINHLGFTINDYALFKAKLQAVGAGFAQDDGESKILAELPGGVSVQMTLDANQQAPIVYSHTQLSAKNGRALRQWYVDVFGGEINKAEGSTSAVILGDRVNFLTLPDSAPLPTQGTAIDHIGFEVADLDAFAKKMGQLDIDLDREPMCIEAINLCIAFMFDPTGTYIEVTEGLARLSR